MFNYFKKIIQLKKVKADIKSLCLGKKILKDVGTFYQGLRFINEQFDMAEYYINNLNRSLTSYLDKQDCLDECLNLLHSHKEIYNNERASQSLEFNRINNIMKENGSEQCSLTIDTEQFIYKYHQKINQIQEMAHNAAINYLIKDKNRKHDKSYITYLNKNELESLNQNNYLYNQLFTLENNLRKYILFKYEKKYNDKTLSRWLKQDQLDSFSQKKEDEHKFGISSRGDNIIYYLDFNDLGNIIQNKFKEGFNLDFKRIDDITPKLNYLYLVRCKIAHNSLCITSDELKMSEVYIHYILRTIYHKINY